MLEAAIAVLLWLFARDQGPVVWLVIAALFVPGLYAMVSGAPFVPTPRWIMNTMFGMAAIKPGEKVYDLGCGDGRLLDRSSTQRRVCRWVWAFCSHVPAGNNPLRFPEEYSCAVRGFLACIIRRCRCDFCYLLTDTMLQFEKHIWPKLPPGCRVLSHAFSMKDVPYAQKKDGVMLYVR